MGEKGLGPAWIDSRTPEEIAPRRPPSKFKWRFRLGGFVLSLIAFAYVTNFRYAIRETKTPLTSPKNGSDNPMDPWSSVSSIPSPLTTTNPPPSPTPTRSLSNPPITTRSPPPAT